MPKSILLVDDSHAVRTLIRRHLERAGLVVCGEASDGVEAVEKALDKSPDLIVMDFSIPRVNGLEAARKLRRNMPHVPIVLFVGHESLVHVSDATKAGVSAIVFKFQAHNLLPQILHLLDRPQIPL